MSVSRRTTGRVWTRDETIFALALYFQLPYGQLDARTPKVIEMAKMLGRGPASLSMKLCNLARLDDTLKRRQISGLAHGAKLETDVWEEFHLDHDKLSQEYDRILRELCGGVQERTVAEDSVLKTPPGFDGVRLMRYRINQTFFRKSILAAYDNKCCITGISDPKLLIASHIKPWAKCVDGREKTNAQNGLCLNALHDRAFDKGLITIDDSFCIVVSPHLRSCLAENVFMDYFKRYEGVRITLPERCPPDLKYIDFHRNHVYVA